MKKLILAFALMVSTIGFSKTEENDLQNNLNDSKIIELIVSQIETNASNSSIFHGEFVDLQVVNIQYDDSFPCTLNATVTGTIVIDGVVTAKVTMSASLQLDNCFDIATIGVTFLKDLANAVIDELSSQMK